MKRIIMICTMLLFCLTISTVAQKNTASAGISIAKARRQCTSSAKASRYMKKVTFKAWDIKNGKKITRTRSIYVHRAIASRVKKAFALIYNGKEKFPIHTVGGFNWRGSTKSLHSLGLAVDINSNENYLIEGKRVLAGSLWKPGKNPYSIPKNGDVIKAMKRVGLKQCIWGKRRDYMHFSVKGY